MNPSLLFVIFLLFLVNTFIFTYGIKSSILNYTSWKILLVPFVLFPLVYLANVFFAWAFVFGPKAGLSFAQLGILNISVWILVVLGAHFFYFKGGFDWQIVIGGLLALAGGVLVVLKTN